MSYSVKPGNVFGRLGEGIGRGFSEQIPKEVERQRLASGLQAFSQNAENLNPMQQLASLAAIPGAVDRPQLIQSFGELAKQAAKGRALQNIPPDQSQQKPNRFPGSEQGREDLKPNNTPSITKEQPLAEIQEGYIPPTLDEIYADARKRYNENPDLFENNPQNAIAAATTAANQNQLRNEAFLRQHGNLEKIQDNVVNRLKRHSEGLGVEIPPDLYSKVEDEAIQATKSKKEGGRGLTEQQAMKEYGKKLDEISRDYNKLKEIGSWGITGRPAKETFRSLKTLQNSFKKNDDLENFASQMIANQQISPPLAYQIAYPVSDVPKLGNAISKLPKIEPMISYKKGFPEFAVPQNIIDQETRNVSEKLAPLLGREGSPLSVARELENKGYNPSVWLNYLSEKNKEFLKDARQVRELETSKNIIPTLNDWWLSEWSGLSEENK